MDELAGIALQDNPDKDQIVAQIVGITNQGMDGTLPLSQSLLSRLSLLQANKRHLPQLITQLKSKVSLSFKRNQSFIRQNAANIYIISSGFKEYIVPVVSQYGIPEQNVFANTFVFDGQGNIIGLDSSNPLSQNQGK